MSYNGKYYVIEITKYNDGTADAYGVYAKDNQTDALQVFHQKMASAMKATNYAFELVHVINEYGVVIKSETFERPVTHTVTFDGNGATSGEMDAQTFTSGVEQALTTNAYVYDGKTFKGWATSTDATEAEYTDGQSITVSADMTLYAIWA